MTLLVLLASDGTLFRRVAATRGGEYSGPCPFCQGVDRFRVWPDQAGGRWWCRQAGAPGTSFNTYLAAHCGLIHRRDKILFVGHPMRDFSGF